MTTPWQLHSYGKYIVQEGKEAMINKIKPAKLSANKTQIVMPS